MSEGVNNRKTKLSLIYIYIYHLKDIYFALIIISWYFVPSILRYGSVILNISNNEEVVEFCFLEIGLIVWLGSYMFGL